MTEALESEEDGPTLQSHPAERYSLLAGAVAGQTVTVSAGGGERSYCDGERIFVADMDFEENAADLRDGLVVQAALLAAGSLDSRTVARMTGRRRVGRRYLTLEAMRACDELGATVPRRVAERLAALYPGPVSRSRDESLARAAGTEDEVPEAPVWLGTIKAGKVISASALIAGGAPTEKDRDGTWNESDMPELDDDEGSERSKLTQRFQVPGIQNPLARYLQKLLGAGRAPQTDGGVGEELPVGSHKARKVGKNARRVEESAARTGALEGRPTGRFYPEWDEDKRVYKQDWCAVAEYDPHPSEDALAGFQDDHRLRRELARLGLAHGRHRRQDEGDVLDITSLIEFVVDRATGTTADHRVYETKRLTAHDLGVLILLDATGSTGESDEERRVFDDQREVAARLTASLAELGDRVATYGFQSWGRQRVHYLRVKSFDDRYDHAAQRRLASLEPGGFTRLGAAVRHGTHLLTNRSGTSNNLLIVVGDGLPYDDGYEHRYAQADCRRALEEAVIAGVGCACVSVSTSTEIEILERVWGHVPYEALDKPDDLARCVIPLFRGALKEAAASRRLVNAR